MTSTTEPRVIRIDVRDNVAVVVTPGGLPAGARLASGLELREAVPEAHKVALADLAKGDAIVRYGATIGYANRAIARGSWVHEGLMTAPAAPPLADCPLGTAPPETLAPLEGYAFEGYRNPDGTVGTKNILGISTTVQCVAPTVEHAVRRIRAEILPRFPHVDDVVAITHPYGCGVAIEAPGAAIPIRTLHNLALHPNFGGEVMVVSLGCEKLQPVRLMSAKDLPVLEESSVAVLQDATKGFGEMVATIMELAEKKLEKLNRRSRETCSASDLVVGLQCGGSDAMSGVTANPAVGFAADLLVRAGATVMFSEVTEVRDAGASANGSGRHAGDCAGICARDGVVRRVPGAGRGGSGGESHAGQQAGRPGQRGGEGDGVDCQSGLDGADGRGRAGRARDAKGADFCGYAGQRLYLRHTATGRVNEHAHLYYRARHAVRVGHGAGDQNSVEQRVGAALARSDRRGCWADCYGQGNRRRGRLGDIFIGFGGGQWEEKSLGGPLGIAQRVCIVQSGTSDVAALGKGQSLRKTIPRRLKPL